jgi:hypothetical protein
VENKKAITEKLYVGDYEILDYDRDMHDRIGFEIRIEACHDDYGNGEDFTFILKSHRVVGSIEIALCEKDPAGSAWAAGHLCAETALDISEALENLDLKPALDCDESEKKVIALAKHLNEPAEDIQNYDFTISETPEGTQFEGTRRAFLVCDDDEREAAYASLLRESLWLVSSWCIADNAPEGIDEYIIDLIKEAEPCEGSNERLHELVKGKWEEFVEAADSYVSYGELLGRYDGEETDIDLDAQTYWIYRTN